ncbi:MAG: OmpA family protein [Pseudomonadota bacterium]
MPAPFPRFANWVALTLPQARHNSRDFWNSVTADDMDVNFSPFEILTGTGALTLCLLFVCIFSEASAIEHELGTQVTAAVNASSGADQLFWSSVEPQGQKIVLTGAAPDFEAKQRAGDLAVAVYGVIEVENSIAVIGEAGTCQREFDEFLKDERVGFKSGRADLSDASLPLLGMLASIIRNCNVPVEIAAHTDAEGDSAINQRLSQRRAEAVRRYLAGSGVSPGLLRARGYGESQPIADNLTEGGRQKNRRVEFRVLGGSS